MLLKSRKGFWGALGIALAGAIAVGCAQMKAQQSPDVDKKEDTALLNVTGDNARLVRFDTKLRQLLGVGPGDSTSLGCIGCDTLSGGTTTPGSTATIKYIIPRTAPAFDAVQKAWNAEWYNGSPPGSPPGSPGPFDAGSGRLVLGLDYNDTPDAICTLALMKSPCFPRPTCRATDYCSQNSVGLCQPACVPK